MLADAIRSEAYRFSKNRMGVFWSTLFVPVLMLVIGVAVYLFTKARMAEVMEKAPELAAEMPAGTVDLGQTLVSAAGGFANPITLLFILIGVATLYAGDYRWETWRLTSARNSRPNLLLGKLAVVTGVTLLALIFWLVFPMVDGVISAAIFDSNLGDIRRVEVWRYGSRSLLQDDVLVCELDVRRLGIFRRADCQ